MLNSDNKATPTDENNSAEEIYEEAGDIMFEAALLRYMPGLDELETSAFEQYINDNVVKESFMEDLYRDYPDFGQILDEELNNLKKEFDSLLLATK